MPPKKTNKNNSYWLLLLIPLVLLIIYGRSTGFSLIDWDDLYYLDNNSMIKTGDFSALSNFDKHIALTLYSFSYKYGDVSTFSSTHHFFNILIHIFNTLLVFLIMRFFIKGKDFLLLLLGLLFAVSPMKAESVVWLIQRKDLLYTFFYLSAFYIYLNYVRNRISLLFIPVFILAWCASVSKIQAATLPFILVIVDVIYRRRDYIKFFSEKALVFYIVFSSEILSEATILAISIMLIETLHEISVQKTESKISQAIRRIKSASLFKTKSIAASVEVLFWIAVTYLVYDSFFIFNIYYLLPNLYLIYNIIIIIIIIRLYALFIPVELVGYRIFSSAKIQLTTFFRTLPFKKAAVIVTLTGVFIFIIYYAYINFFSYYFPATYSPESVAYTITDKITLILYSFSYYLYKFFLPYNLNPVVLLPLKEGSGLPASYNILPAVVLLLLAALLVYVFLKKKAWLKNKMLLLGAGYFLANIGMVIHIFDMDTLVVVANRYTYNAYTGLIMILGFVVSESLTQNPKLRNVIYTVIIGHLLVWAVYTYNYSNHWRNSEAFWSFALKKDNNNYYAYNGLGNHQKNTGNFFKAVDYFSKAISLRPQLPYLYMNRAQMYIQIENYDAALQDYNTIIRLEPDNEEAFYKRGSLYFMQGALDKCESDILRSLALVPGYPPALLLQAILMFDRGQYQEAKAVLDSIPPEKREPLYFNLYGDVLKRLNP